MHEDLPQAIEVMKALSDDRPMRLKLPRGWWLHIALLIQLAVIHPSVHDLTRQKGCALIEAVRRKLRKPVQEWLDRAGKPIGSERIRIRVTGPSEPPFGSTWD